MDSNKDYKDYKIIKNYHDGTYGRTTEEDFVNGLGKDKDITNWHYQGNSFSYADDKQTTCICRHIIKNNYYIRNDKMKEIRIVGCECVKRVFGNSKVLKCTGCTEMICFLSKTGLCKECKKSKCLDCDIKFKSNKGYNKCVDCRKIINCVDCDIKFKSNKGYNKCNKCRKIKLITRLFLREREEEPIKKQIKSKFVFEEDCDDIPKPLFITED